jgi:hypothetical protein
MVHPIFIDQAVVMTLAYKNVIIAVMVIVGIVSLASITIVAISIGGGDSDVTTAAPLLKTTGRYS